MENYGGRKMFQTSELQQRKFDVADLELSSGRKHGQSLADMFVTIEI